jgi:hypothetical protein
VAAKHARPRETAARLSRILDHFGTKKLSYLNKKTCEEYVGARGHKMDLDTSDLDEMERELGTG